jgi:hypothetical protein
VVGSVTVLDVAAVNSIAQFDALSGVKDPRFKRQTLFAIHLGIGDLSQAELLRADTADSADDSARIASRHYSLADCSALPASSEMHNSRIV